MNEIEKINRRIETTRSQLMKDFLIQLKTTIQEREKREEMEKEA